MSAQNFFIFLNLAEHFKNREKYVDKVNKKEGIERLLLEAHDCLCFNTP